MDIDDLSGRGSSEVLADLARCIRSSETFLLTTHVNPDGDAFGSELALALALDRLGKSVRVANDQPVPDRYAPFLPVERVEVVRDDLGDLRQARFDCCVLLDTSEPARAGLLAEIFFAPGQRRICLDHHLVPQPVAFDAHLVQRSAAATGCLVLALLDELGVPLDRPIAEALWVAIASDTGWFRFSNTTGSTLRDVARLLECGLDLEALGAALYAGHSAERTRAFGEVLEGLETELEGRWVRAVVSADLLERRGVTLAELDGLVDSLKAIRGTRIASLITERGERLFKASLRSIGTTSVEAIARSFGGGGHAKAAGFSWEGDLDSLLAALRQAVARALEAEG